LIARVQRAQNQLRQLYEEVRLWAAPINLDRERSDLAEVWRQAWQHAVQVQPERDLTLLEDITCDVVCAIDKSRMEQVFRNIFENALEVSPPTARVTLRCENLATDSNYVRVTILDMGPGLTAEQQQRMFEPFFTTKTKGTGLGLSITQRIVQAHQGRITAASPGGAQIEIVLPRGQ
jgi:signal transduction histidine kinase